MNDTTKKITITGLIKSVDCEHPNLGACIFIYRLPDNRAIVKKKHYNADLFYNVIFSDLIFN